MHAAQERARLEAQLLDEQLAALAVDLERLRLPAGAVEREHELCPQPLAQRMRADERLELADELRVLADRELRLRALLHQREVELLEPRDLLPRERLVAELGQRLAPPQRERVVEQRRRAGPARSPARRRRGFERARGRAAPGRAGRGSPAGASRSRPGRAPSSAARRSSGATRRRSPADCPPTAPRPDGRARRPVPPRAGAWPAAPAASGRRAGSALRLHEPRAVPGWRIRPTREGCSTPARPLS